MRLFLRIRCRIHEKYQFWNSQPRVTSICQVDMEWPKGKNNPTQTLQKLLKLSETNINSLGKPGRCWIHSETDWQLPTKLKFGDTKFHNFVVLFACKVSYFLYCKKYGKSMKLCCVKIRNRTRQSFILLRVKEHFRKIKQDHLELTICLQCLGIKVSCLWGFKVIKIRVFRSLGIKFSGVNYENLSWNIKIKLILETLNPETSKH
jgi:hypothetical protein